MRRVAGLLMFCLTCFSNTGTRAADPDKINDAIRRGVAFLQASDLSNPESRMYGLGIPGLAGLALLEAEVRPDDAQLRALQTLIRNQAIGETGTYQVSLAILFLDRLGDEADRGLIQILGARLLAGQTISGGWSYGTFDTVGEDDIARIRASLSTPTARGKLHPEAVRILSLHARGQRPNAALGADDNSNTQFALLGAWVARRHGIPADRALSRVQFRFLRSQSPADGGWGYTFSQPSTPSMTCAGLLALAAGKALSEFELTAAAPERPPGSVPEGDDPFFRPPAPGANIPNDADASLPPPPPVDPIAVQMRDKAIEKALKSLGTLIQLPGTVGSGFGSTHGGIDDLYFYWSLERVAVAFDLQTIGGVDWYNWGCEAILPAQQADGSWIGNYNSPIVATAFAVLFLKKANLTPDLTRQVTGKVKDPGGAELRGGRGNLPITPMGNPVSSPPTSIDEEPRSPEINKLRQRAAAEAIANNLVNSSDQQWPTILRRYRDAPGPEHTYGIVQALAALEGRRHYEARQALAERLTRMTRDTLRRMLTDRDAELRRAACLAIIMKDDRELIPEVIDCLLDPNDIVVRAAKAGLKTISGEDRGPPVGASEEEKRAAADSWRLWYELDKRRNK